MRRQEAIFNRLYGLRLTPEVVYNAIPWTWALDWFTNTGDIMANISALSRDGLTLEYGFLMQEARVHTVTVAESTDGGVRRTARLENINYTKRRVRANPYGFGLTGLATTNRQKAIIAAIAATKGKTWRL